MSLDSESPSASHEVTCLQIGWGSIRKKSCLYDSGVPQLLTWM